MQAFRNNELEITTNTVNGQVIVQVAGTLDGWHYQMLEESLRKQIVPGREAVIVDLTELVFASIGGMYALVEALRSVQYDIKLYVIAKGDVLRVIHRTRFDLKVNVCRSLGEATQLLLPYDSGAASKLLYPNMEEDEGDLPMAA